jgi:mRNA interferase MazF
MAISRGEIYFVNLDPASGREQSGTRPVVVLSTNTINRLPLVITVVIGTKGANVTRDFPTNVRVPPTESGLPLETVFLGFQVRSIDIGRFPPRPSGRLSSPALDRVEDAVRHSLGL